MEIIIKLKKFTYENEKNPCFLKLLIFVSIISININYLFIIFILLINKFLFINNIYANK